MIRVTKLTDYAMVIMAFLGSNPEKIHQAAEIAASVGIARPTVAKLLKKLTQAGLLISIRGAHGGYKLAVAADKISIADIIETLEGPLAIMACNLGKQHCSFASKCNISSPWLQINKVIQKALESFKLSAMVSSQQSSRC